MGSTTRLLLFGLAAVAALALAGLILMVLVFPPRISVAPESGSVEVRPGDEYLEIGTSRWGAAIDTVAVQEARIAADGTRESGRLIEGKLRDGRFLTADGSNPLAPDAEYTVTVSGTVKKFGLAGITTERVDQVITFTTTITPMPVLPAQGLIVKHGEEALLEWNVPVSSFEYTLEGAPSSSIISSDDGRVTYISLGRFEQGKEYPLKITAATSAEGVSLKQPISGKVVTAPALAVAFEPADGSGNASTTAHPTLIFSEPVSNPELAQSLVSIEPAVAGSLSWVAPDRLEFVPAAPWEHLQDVTMRLKGGTSGLRGITGGYVEVDALSTFTTAPAKAILVDISDQTLTLLENGVVVEQFLASTGLSGTPTPIGEYTIYAKLSKTDMRGEGYFAPNVPWVLVFKGDYTIHGNYWATAFGRPSSHGCVGLPVDTAKHVYDWTPMGTPVTIQQ